MLTSFLLSITPQNKVENHLIAKTFFRKMTIDTEFLAPTPEKALSTLCNPENPKMATGQTEKFPVHSKHHRLACFAKNGRKKAVNLFQDLLLHVLSLCGGLFNFGIGWAAALLAIRQPGKCFLSLCYF